MADPRRFRLIRDDIGAVAEGIEFTDGSAMLRWMAPHPSSVVFHDQGIRQVRSINGFSHLEWIDDMETAEIPLFEFVND